MKYFSWLWNNSRGIRWNTVVRIIAGIIQVVLSLLMVWLSKRFLDERSGKAERMKFWAAAIGSDSAMKPLLRQSYGSNKSSIETSLSTMLRCIPSATPKVVTKVLTKDFRVFVFSLKIAIRRRKVCS